MASKYLQKYPVPEGFHQILHDFAREVLRDQPDDIIKYGADYFECMTQGKEFKFESKYNIAKGEAPARVHKPPKPSNMTEKAKIVVEMSNNRPDSQQVKRVGSGNPNNVSHVSSQGSFPEEKKAAKEYVNNLYDKVTKDIDEFENPIVEQTEELPKLTSFDDRDMQNIIKIQAAAKGKIVRNQVNKNQKKSKEEDLKLKEKIIDEQEQEQEQQYEQQQEQEQQMNEQQEQQMNEQQEQQMIEQQEQQMIEQQEEWIAEQQEAQMIEKQELQEDGDQQKNEEDNQTGQVEEASILETQEVNKNFNQHQEFGQEEE